ncbi:nitrate- and nitrite sensing domain-containing protein [Streptomyces sp. NPDC050560]|uniref:sensor histidine kinase n=1 Tax=Streptomyces sp. NPDC050560 TaxID=3365630 RepID=UPI00379B74A1
MQGRFKRDGSASAGPEPQGGPERGAQAQHAQNTGPQPSGDGGDSTDRASAPGGAQPPKPAPAPKQQLGPGPRIAMRNWRISTRVVSLLALPVVAASTLGGLRINDSLDDIRQLDNMKLLTDMTKQATQLASALQEERDSSAGPLAHGTKQTDFDIKGPRAATDRAQKAFIEETEEIDKADGREGLEGVRSSIVQITGQLNNIKVIRKEAFYDQQSSSQTVDAYSQLVQQLLALTEDMAQATSNPEMVQRTRALAAFSSAKEYASVQRAVIAAALPGNSTQAGDLSETDRRYALAASDKERSELAIFSGIYTGNSDTLLQPLDDGNPTVKEASNYIQQVLTQPDGIKRQEKRSYKDWLDADSTKLEAMDKIELTLLSEMEQKARDLRDESKQSAIISGALILIVLGVSLVGAFVVARSMIRSLRRLQETATKVAQDRLPELVKQLSESDPQDIDSSVESVGVHSRDEIGRVAAAFDDVHREAVRLAAEQALLRGNVNAMFTNLSRRSQGLIQRQLSLISELESREADPDQLSSLFKLDHLATRMRRNGENLLVLAGEEPGRRWTRPVPLVDVLRAAASEVEQYERIELAAIPATEVAGRVVNDLVHLLAELLENATSFSSPQTKVKVTGHALPDGRVLIEIHDTGIGLSPEDLAAINERLASPPTVDVSVSRRMGLFVVGRLSQRHGIRIQLRPSDSGGTTALVMLPVDVAQGGRKAPAGKPGAPAAGGPAAAQAAVGAAAARRPGGVGAQGPERAGRLGAGAPPRGQVGAGTPPRPALPSRGGDGGPQEPGGFPAGRPVPASAGAFDDRGVPTGNRSEAPPQRQGRGRPGDAGRPQLPPRGGPRAELPGGNPQPQQSGPPRVTSWGGEGAQQQMPRPGRDDAPRGHEEPEGPSVFARRGERGGPGSTSELPRIGGERPGAGGAAEEPRFGPGSTSEIPRITDEQQGPGSTSQFPVPDYDAPPPGAGTGGQYVRPDVFGPPRSAAQRPGPGFDARRSGGQDTGAFASPGYDERGGAPENTGSYPMPGGYDTQGTGQYATPGYEETPSGQYQTPGYDNPQDPSTSGQYPTPAYDERGAAPENTGSYPMPGGYDGRPGAGDPAATGQFAAQGYDESPSGQYQAPGYGERPPARGESTGSFERPGFSDGPPQRPQQQRGMFDAARPPLPGRPDAGGIQRRPTRPTGGGSLPPSNGQGDGRTPLYDTLETNWFRGGGSQGPEQVPGQRGGGGEGRPDGAGVGTGGLNGANGSQGQNGANSSSPWRSSPNDELGRQAERVRQPTAGGVTTSGLPRRVPRANLVAGTAQQQQHQAGPQVSRAPDDVRGRLTNLRRGIQQGRQAGTGSATGSFPSPTHQQER